MVLFPLHIMHYCMYLIFFLLHGIISFKKLSKYNCALIDFTSGLSKILINCTFTFLLGRLFQTTYCTLKSACFVTVLLSDLKVHKIFGITSCQANTSWKHIIYSKNLTFLMVHKKWYWRCNILMPIVVFFGVCKAGFEI